MIINKAQHRPAQRPEPKPRYWSIGRLSPVEAAREGVRCERYFLSTLVSALRTNELLVTSPRAVVMLADADTFKYVKDKLINAVTRLATLKGTKDIGRVQQLLRAKIDRQFKRG